MYTWYKYRRMYGKFSNVFREKICAINSVKLNLVNKFMHYFSSKTFENLLYIPVQYRYVRYFDKFITNLAC